MIVFWLFVAWAVERAQMVMSFQPSAFNGYACIDQVNQRKTVAPMCYRVLLPWLTWLIERIPAMHGRRLTWIYEPFRIGMTTLALWATAQAFDFTTALLMAALLPLTFLFDYWDWSVELFAVMAALTGQFWLVLIGALLLALSRETAPLVPAAYWLATGDWQGTAVIGAVTAGTMLVVRLWAGEKRLNCDRFMARQNWKDVRSLFGNRPFYLSEIAIALVISALTLAAILEGLPGWPIAALTLGGGWILARAAETRVFALCLPWCAQFVLRTGGLIWQHQQ
jgi:hypothetical protein